MELSRNCEDYVVVERQSEHRQVRVMEFLSKLHTNMIVLVSNTKQGECQHRAGGGRGGVVSIQHITNKKHFRRLFGISSYLPHIKKKAYVFRNHTYNPCISLSDAIKPVRHRVVATYRIGALRR